MSDNTFECIRCNFKTNKKSVMINHLNRKKKCNKSLIAFSYTDEECKKLSLIQKKYKKESELKCIYCEKIYCNNNVLDIHIKKYCKKKYDCQKEESTQNINNITNIEQQQNITNIGQQNIINNINNIIIIPNMNNNIVSFDNNWITEHINIHLKHLILIGEHKYSDLLKQILENKNNLNVIIDKNENIGFVYDSNNTYKNMEKSEIINLSMEKLNNELNKIKDEIINNSIIDIKYNDQELSIIDDKYENYKKNKIIQKNVEEIITDIYDKKKEDALELYEKVINNKIIGY
jgi:hypothetical protein